MKLLVIGSQLSGKTTLARYLRKHSTEPVFEIDEEILKLNNNEWPEDNKYKDNVLIPKIYKSMASKGSVIFITKSAFPASTLNQFKRASFKIILLRLSRSEISRRNEHRMKHESYADATPWIDGQLANHEDILAQGYIDDEIDASQSTEDIANALLNYNSN